MEKVNVSPAGAKIMALKGFTRIIKLEHIGYAAANILKQEALSLGAEAAIPGDIYFGKRERTDVLLLGTLRHYRQLTRKLRSQPLSSLQTIADEIEQALARYDGQIAEGMTIGDRRFVWRERTYVMGIVNATPDSFSGDGLVNHEDTVEAALAQAERFVEAGVDILDIGGESTRPGSTPISAEEEIARAVPVVERLDEAFETPISIDTYKAAVAEAALDAGADLVNDVWGLRMDPALADLVAARGVPIVLMHNRSKPKNAVQHEQLGGHYVGIDYDDLLADVIRELRMSVEKALDAGIARGQIIVDPGLGFGKIVRQNLELMRRLSELKVLGYPILVGPSRKSFIGHTLDLPVEERLEGTAATVAACIARGADIVRVHDVQAMTRVARMTDAIVRR
jgi:dihydropteroate synthase